MRMMDLTDQWLELYNMIDELEDDSMDDAILDTLEGIEGEIDQKADKVAHMIRLFEEDQAAAKAKKEYFERIEKTDKNKAAWLKKNLEVMMKMTGKTKIKTENFNLNIQKNAPSLKLDCDDIEKFPAEFTITEITHKLDSTHIKEILKGEDEDAKKKLEGLAHLEQSESIRIRG